MANVVKLYYVDTGTTYKQWELIPNKLLIVEDIASYLATKTAYTINDFQYVKNELEIGINVDLSQSYSQPNSTTSFKYVSIQNSGENIHYYFIKKIIWRSKSAVRLELVMDVLNTFKENTDYIFKENTRIIREHKNRFSIEGRSITLQWQIASSTGTINTGDSVYLINDRGTTCFTGIITYQDSHEITIKITSSETEQQIRASIDEYIEYTFELDKDAANYILFDMADEYEFSYDKFRNIDYIQENINPILQCGNAEGLKIQNGKVLLEQDWFLMYRNQDDPSDSLVNPVECYLLPENSTPVSEGSLTSGRLTKDNIQAGKWYYVQVSLSNSFTLPDGTTWPNDYPSTLSLANFITINKNTNGKLNVVYSTKNASNLVFVASFTDLEYITLNNLPCAYMESSTYYPPSNISYSATGSWDNTDAPNYLDPITAIDKTDAKIIKIIKLPYCPYDFSVVNGKLDIPNSDWQYTSLDGIYCLKLNNLNTKLKGTINIPSYNSPFDNLKMADFEPSINDLRQGANYESKLFHSEFYQPTYAYDSFSFKVQLEKCTISSYLTTRTAVIFFDMTRTINSKFLFTFASYHLKNAEENYPISMPIARNNEEVLYNVPYINYIRSGYQYDIKNKNIATISNAIGLGLSVASVGASLLAPSVPLKVAGVVASLVSVANSVKNTIVAELQNENSIQQKIKQTQNQATSVAGSDDVDLMSVYAENRLKYLVYSPNAVMKNLIYDLFFYAGYNSGRMGKPTHNNRINFDYLECEASIEAISSIPDECLTELINCFKAGITYLHKTSRASNKWDFAQKYENWETMFFTEE